MTAHGCATVSVAPVLLAIGFFARHYHVRPEAFTTWYFGSVAAGVALWLWLAGRWADLHPGSTGTALGIVAVGLSVSAAASVIVFFASAGLADRLPRLFDRVNTDLDRFLGIVLVIAGMFLIAGGWSLLGGARMR